MPSALVTPAVVYVPSYVAALREGEYCPMQLSFALATPEVIESDPEGYIRQLTAARPFAVNVGGLACQVREHEVLWIVDGPSFIGTVALRYKADAPVLRERSGHVGLAIRPALVGRGYGPRVVRRAVPQLAKRFLDRGIPEIYLTCFENNTASRRLIEYFGGVFLKEGEAENGNPAKRVYRIDLGPPAVPPSVVPVLSRGPGG